MPRRSSTREREPGPPHHFRGVRPGSPLRLVAFLALTLGAIGLLLRGMPQ